MLIVLGFDFEARILEGVVISLRDFKLFSNMTEKNILLVSSSRSCLPVSDNTLFLSAAQLNLWAPLANICERIRHTHLPNNGQLRQQLASYYRLIRGKSVTLQFTIQIPNYSVFQCLFLSYVYRSQGFSDVIELFTGSSPNHFWRFCWDCFCPTIILSTLVALLWKLVTKGLTYEVWSEKLERTEILDIPLKFILIVFTIVGVVVLCIPAVAICRYFGVAVPKDPFIEISTASGTYELHGRNLSRR